MAPLGCGVGSSPARLSELFGLPDIRRSGELTIRDIEDPKYPEKVGTHIQEMLDDSAVRGMDCVQGLATLLDKSVSLVLSEPPYFIDRMDDKWDHKRLQSCAHRSSGVSGGCRAA